MQVLAGINRKGVSGMSNLKVKANKLTEWMFNIPSVGECKKPVAVEVRLLVEKEGLRLRATCQDKLIEPIEDSDIERLRERVEAALEALGMGIKIEWLDYIQIQVHGGRDDLAAALYSKEWNARESVDVKADLVKYGIHPITQVPYILDGRGYPPCCGLSDVYLSGEALRPEPGMSIYLHPGNARKHSCH